MEMQLLPETLLEADKKGEMLPPTPFFLSQISYNWPNSPRSQLIQEPGNSSLRYQFPVTQSRGGRDRHGYEAWAHTYY